MTDIQRAMLGDHEAAARLAEQGVLIPCPFCGEDKELTVKNNFGYRFGNSWMYCYACEGFGPTTIGEQAARLAWNTRAPLLTQEQIERLEEMK